MLEPASAASHDTLENRCEVEVPGLELTLQFRMHVPQAKPEVKS